MADPLWSSVVVLSHLDQTDGTAINLGSGNGSFFLNDGFSTTTTKFGAASSEGQVVYQRGSGSAVDFPADFCIECWFYWTAPAGDDCVILQIVPQSGSAYSVTVLDDGSVGGTIAVGAAGTVAANAWNHVALQRASGVTELIVGGVSVGTVSDSTAILDVTLNWGVWDITLANFVDEVRATTTSRYTAPFTPPTAAFDAFGTGGTVVQGDGASTGISALAAVGATRSALTASSSGTSTPTADAVDKTPVADGAAAGTGDPQGHIANATQTGGWSQLNYWPPATAWALSSDSKTATLAPTVLYDEIRGVRGKSTGKWYFEIGTSAVSSKGVGITQTGVALGTGSPPVRYASAFISTWGFAFDADTLEYWVRSDGAWNAGGPEALAAADGTLLPGTQVPYADQSASSGSGQTFVARFTAADLLSAPPAGFTPIDDMPGNSGAAAGTSAALGIGSAGSGGAGVSAGAGVGASLSVNGRVGAASAAGGATASADGTPATARDAAATGTAAAAALARSTAAAQALAAGLSAGTGRMLYEIVGLTAGVGVAAAQSGGRTKFEVGPTARSAAVQLTATSSPKEIIASTPETALT